MRAVILAGGKGTRLRPYTTVLPKPLVPIGERPILETIMRQLDRAGFNQIDLCVGYLGGLIRAYFEEGEARPRGVDLTYHWEKEPLGTAGALHMIDAGSDALLVMNGDILTNLDYAAFMRDHTDSGAALTIATHEKDVSLSLGVIEGDTTEVTGYVEKPTLHYRVSMGIYAYSPLALTYVPTDRRFDFPELVLALLEAGEEVRSYPFEGAWYDIGTTDEHDKAMAAWDAEPGFFDRP